MLNILFFIESLSGGGAEKADVVAAIEKNGFDSRVFARRLCALYEEAMEKDA